MYELMKEFLHISPVGEMWVECKTVYETENDYMILYRDPFTYKYKEILVSKERIR